MTSNNELNLAYNFVRFTDKSLFLTGKAGTGKTTFLKKVVNEVNKRAVVVAPTGVAAINAGGVTIHSFFQMPFGPIIPGQNFHDKEKAHKVTKKKIDMIRALDLVIIDEISMVRADLLDGIDQVLQKYRRNKKPFGGVQMLMIGDLQQLAPVARPEEWSMLQQYYDTPYFFSAQSFHRSEAISIALTQVFRQTDHYFLSILEEIRNNTITTNTLNQINERFDSSFSEGENEGYITLTTHNASANSINMRRLEKIRKAEYTFTAKITGKFPEQNFPTEENLILKEGAQVMFVKNDPSPDKQFYNGKIGIISRIEDDIVYVNCEGDASEISCERLEWENKRYDIDERSAEMTEQVIGTFSQFPLRLAWAITIHKSQGLTFDKVIIDAEMAFAHGQTYVALSRCSTLEGIVLSSRIDKHAIICDRPVAEFTKNIELNPPTRAMLEASKRAYQLDILIELFDFNPLEKAFFYTKRFIRNAPAQISGDLYEAIEKIENSAIKQIVSVGLKFSAELKSRIQGETDAEQDPLILERLKKSAGYFTELLEKEIEKPFEDATWATDNTTVKTQMRNRVAEISSIIICKKAELDSLKSGFSIQKMLDARAKSLFDKQNVKKKQEKDLKTENPELYRTLVKWRSQKAKELDVPLYFVASNKLLVIITNELPVEKHHLLSLPGLGKTRVEKFGVEIIDHVENFCQKSGISPGETPLKKKKTKPEKGNSAMQSLDLFKKGLGIEEIALARELSPSTICSHLAQHIGSGEVKLKDLVEDDKVALITKFLKHKPQATLSEAKSALTDDISYEDIRFVFAANRTESN